MPLADERFIAKLATVYPNQADHLLKTSVRRLFKRLIKEPFVGFFSIAEMAGEPTTFPEFILNTRHAMSNAFIVNDSGYLSPLLRNLPSASVGELLDRIEKTATDYPDANMFIISSLLEGGVPREKEEVIAKIKRKLLPSLPRQDRRSLLSIWHLVLDKILKPIRVGRQQ